MVLDLDFVYFVCCIAPDFEFELVSLQDIHLEFLHSKMYQESVNQVPSQVSGIFPLTFSINLCTSYFCFLGQVGGGITPEVSNMTMEIHKHE